MDMEEFRAVPSTSQATAQAGKPNTKKDKQDVLDELIELLKKIVDCCLLVVTCGCYPGLKKGLNGIVGIVKLSFLAKVEFYQYKCSCNV